MKKSYILFAFIIFFPPDFLSVSAQCGPNLLTNPGFDSPIQPALGDNITSSFIFNGWTMTGGVFNIVKVNGSTYVFGPDNAVDGNQYADITSAGGTIYQDFSISGPPVPIVFGGYFSSCDQAPYTDWTASIQIYKLPSNTLMATSTTRLFKASDGYYPAQENWYLLNGSVTLNSGNYRFLVNMADFGNFDAASVRTACAVPT